MQDFDYTFVLTRDCNRNGIIDYDPAGPDDLDVHDGWDLWPNDDYLDCCQQGGCAGDYNDDGSVDQGDVDCLIAQIAGSPPCYPFADPDFNHDGNADQTDVSLLVTLVSSGECPF